MLGRSVHLSTLFSCASLTKQLTNYFMHIISLVTDNNPSWSSRREENGRRNYFMINLHGSMGPGQDQTRDPWICSQPCYLLPYAAWYIICNAKWDHSEEDQGCTWLPLWMLGIFPSFVVVCWLFSKLRFFKKCFRNTIRVSNSLDPDQTRPRGYKTIFMLNST